MRSSLIITNLCWAIGLLAALLIGSISVSWASVKEFPTILSVSLGLSSMLLSLIAIIQAVTSTNSISNSLSNINIIAERAREASDNISSASRSLAEQAEIVGTLPSALGEMRKEIAAISAPNKEIAQTSAETPQNRPASGQLLTTDEMYDLGTPGTTASIYACVLSAKHNKTIDPEKMFPGDRFAETMYGVILTLRITGAIDAEYMDGRFLVRNTKQLTSEIVWEWIEHSKEMHAIPTLINAIDKYFGQPPSLADPDPESSSTRSQPRQKPGA